MTKYEVQFSPFLNKYAVINSMNGVAQSFCECPIEAGRVARDLTAQVAGPKTQVKQPERPALKVVRHLRVVS